MFLEIKRTAANFIKRHNFITSSDRLQYLTSDTFPFIFYKTELAVLLVFPVTDAICDEKILTFPGNLYAQIKSAMSNYTQCDYQRRAAIDFFCKCS